jgi:protein-tyrosine phosphatase
MSRRQEDMHTLSRTLGSANANFVTERLAVGGDCSVDDVALATTQAIDLVAAGITHVLDVRLELDDAELWSLVPEVTYRWAGIDDVGQRIPAEWFDDVVGWCLDALRDPDAKVLTHCHMGINRGPSAGYAVLLGLGYDPVEAIALIRASRPIANVWYAEDALRWWHLRTGASEERRRSDHRRLRQWRQQNPLDVVRIIAERREAERRLGPEAATGS